MTPKDPLPQLAERVYTTRGADLIRYLRQRSKNDADAREIAQEAFFRFLRLSHPERLSNPEAYIFRIAANLLWERQLRQDSLRGDETGEVLTTEATPFDFTLSDQLVARVRGVLDSLPPTQRAVLILRVRDQMSFADIAVHTGISQTMVRKHFTSALAACRERLKDLMPQGADP